MHLGNQPCTPFRRKEEILKEATKTLLKTVRVWLKLSPDLPLVAHCVQTALDGVDSNVRGMCRTVLNCGLPHPEMAEGSSHGWD